VVLAEAAKVLRPRGILMMPLKGIWLQELAYADPSERPITDVDVLVAERHYTLALSSLRAAGWTYLGSNVSEASLRAPGLPLPLDLHRRLFSRGAFRMPSTELFERGTRDRDVYGVEVMLPHALDVLAHLVGHFVKSRGGPDSERVQMRDFGVVAAAAALEPSVAARHLERCGVARAARYALRCAEAYDRGGFCEATLRALAPDLIGEVCAGAMLRLRRRAEVTAKTAVLPGFVLETSLPRALETLVLRAWDRRADEQRRDR
jgi:hypothetical protein